MFVKIINKKLLIFYAGIVLCHRCIGEDLQREVERNRNRLLEEETTKPPVDTREVDMENAIKKVEALDQIITKLNIVSSGDTEKFYDNMIVLIDGIAKAIKHPENANKFIEAKGIVRVMSSNLTKKHSKLRTKLLLLLKDLFDVAPISTDERLPLSLIDRLLDIFENDRNLALKAHAVDILYKWLPGNPNAQVRVMKLKGLETFYYQIEALDTGVIQTLIELLNKILKEHLDVRNDEGQATKDDDERLVMYQRIGLLEHFSSPTVCKGMLDILEMLWSFNNNENENINTVLVLIKNVKPFCSKIFMKKSKAINMFKALLEHVKDEERKEYFDKLGVDVADSVKVLEEYLDEINLAKDEL